MKPRLNSLSWMPSITSGGNLAPSLWWSMVVVAASYCGDVFQWQGMGDRIEVKMKGVKYREILDENLFLSSQDLRLGRRFAFQQDNMGVASGQVYECPWVAQAEPGLQPDRTSLERPKTSCAATLPIQPDSAWEDLQRRMWETSQYRCAKLVTSYPRRLKAVIAAKGASTKNWVKGLNTYINVVFQFFILYKLAKKIKLFLLCHYGVLCGGEKNKCNEF